MQKLLGLLLLLPALAFGQSVPNGGITNQQVWTTAQWIAGWQSKADTATTPSYPQTAAEISASVTPTNYTYPAGNALRYGADPTGGADSTAALNNCHATLYLCYYPTGLYKISSGITVPGGGIKGDGTNKTIIITTDTASANLYTFTGNVPVMISDVQVQLSTTKTGGYAFVFQPAAGENANSRIRNISTIGINAINFVAASQWVLADSTLLNCVNDCVTINNTNNADSGDSAVYGNVFNNSTSTSANAIRQIASGGLKITGNKFNNGGVGYFLDYGTIGSTSDLLVTGNSFENAHFSAIQFQRTTGTQVFANIVITGNQFYVHSSTGSSSAIFAGGSSSFLFRFIASGNNVFVQDNTAAAAAFSLDRITNLSIVGNTITGAGGASTNGVFLGANNVQAAFGTNSISGFAINANLSPANTQIVPRAASALFGGAGTCALINPINMTSCVRNSAGNYTITLPAYFTAAADFICVGSPSAFSVPVVTVSVASATTVNVSTMTTAGTLTDSTANNIVCTGF